MIKKGMRKDVPPSGRTVQLWKNGGNMNPIERIIRQLVSRVKKGYFFDSHYIIDTLIRDHSDIYMQFVAQHVVRSKVTEHIHGAIAKLIGKNTGLVRRVTDKSFSYNIRGKASSCVLWEKI
jgi:hypothetical protein